MLSDAQWALLEPLIEACRPKGKTPPQDLRRTLSAILWRHQNGAKWRAVPEELGPWWRAAQIFIRWARAGVWERLRRIEWTDARVEQGEVHTKFDAARFAELPELAKDNWPAR